MVVVVMVVDKTTVAAMEKTVTRKGSQDGPELRATGGSPLTMTRPPATRVETAS